MRGKIHLAVLILIFLLAIVLRLCFLSQPMRYDESFTFTNYASKPLSIALSDYSYPNNHIFHTFLVHIAYRLLGNKPWIIRLPAFLAGILLVPASYMAIRTLYNKYAALLTAGLVGASSILIEYSTNARGYTILCLIFLLSLSIAKYLLSNKGFFMWIILSVLSAIGFYTIPIMIYPFGIIVVWLFLSIIFKNTHLARGYLFRNLFISIIATGVITYVLYIPVIMTSGLKSIIANRFVTAQAWKNFSPEFQRYLYSIWNEWNRDIPVIIQLFFIVGFFISLIFHNRLSKYRIPVVAAVFLWCISFMIIQRSIPYNRTWLFLLPLYLGLASSGITYTIRRMVNYKSASYGIFSLIMFFLLSFNTIKTRSIWYSEETGSLRDAEQITVFLRDYLEPGDGLFTFVPSDAPLEYYFNMYGVPVGYFRADLSLCRRIIIVVNKSSNQSLEGFLDMLGLSDSAPKLLKEYKTATLYEIKRI